MVITLIGYRGSGKSTVAPPLADRLGYVWADADAEIERIAGRTIREIFIAEHEAGFRRREREALAQLLALDRLVLAAGGGAILDPDTRARMRAAGPVVWLKAPVATLADRIAADPATAVRRPSLAGGGVAEIERLLAEREPLYRETATLEIDTDGHSALQIVDKIVRLLQPALP